jgi:hypothetical protein
MLDELRAYAFVSVGFVDEEVSEPAYVAVTDCCGKADSFVIVESYEAAFGFKVHHEFEVVFH